MKFRLDKALGDLLEATVRRAGRDLAAGRPRAPHRDKRGELGGKFAQALRSPKGIVTRKRWGGVIRWADLGSKFMWLVLGTKRKHGYQPRRPVTLAPDEDEVRAVVEAEAARYFAERDRRRGKRGR